MLKHIVKYIILGFCRFFGEIVLKKSVFVKNAAILTATSLLLRFAGIIFKVWLSAKIGSEGIGLHQLVFSFYVLASTFATSGISTAVTRLCSEEIANNHEHACKKILLKATLLTLIIALFSTAIIILNADFIAIKIIGDPNSIPALKMLPLSLPFMGITACLRGFFISRRKIFPNSFGQIFEQIVRIVFIMLFISRFVEKGIGACCFGIILGDAFAEIFGFVILFIFYLVESKNLLTSDKNYNPPHILKRILHITIPITSGRYLNSLLRTGENVLVPKNLAKYRFSSKNALSQFGMIKGMALPLLFFPSAILNSVSLLLIPEISEASARHNTHAIKTAGEKIIKLTLLCGLPCGILFLFGGGRLGELIYHDKEVGKLLTFLSPIVPFMYLDSICDGILKGLDQQSFTFKTAVSDSIIRIILIIIILPKMGMLGFIIIMYFSNLYTCVLNVGRLIKISGAKIKISTDIFLPLLSSVTAIFTTYTFLRFLNLQNDLVYIILFCGISSVFYLLLLLYLQIIPIKPVKNAIYRLKKS